jgi:hypothetical protein
MVARSLATLFAISTLLLFGTARSEDSGASEALDLLRKPLPWGGALVKGEFGKTRLFGPDEVEYIRQGDPKAFLGVPIDIITYSFVKGRLRYVRIYIEPEHAEGMRRALESEYGVMPPEFNARPNWLSKRKTTFLQFSYPEPPRSLSAIAEFADSVWLQSQIAAREKRK